MGGVSGAVGTALIPHRCGKHAWKTLMAEFWLGLVL